MLTPRELERCRELGERLRAGIPLTPVEQNEYNGLTARWMGEAITNRHDEINNYGSEEIWDEDDEEDENDWTPNHYGDDADNWRQIPNPLVHSPVIIGRKRKHSDESPDDEELDLDELEPHEINELDTPRIYNPLNHAYPITLEELNIEIMVQFDITDTGQRTTLEFTDHHTGKAHVIPFFPVKDEEDGNPGHGYQRGEKPYYIQPMIVRAKVAAGPNAGNLLTYEQTALAVPPERMEAALEQFYQQVTKDPSAPFQLKEIMEVVTGRAETRWSSYGDDGDDDFYEDEDEMC